MVFQILDWSFGAYGPRLAGDDCVLQLLIWEEIISCYPSLPRNDTYCCSWSSLAIKNCELF